MACARDRMDQDIFFAEFFGAEPQFVLEGFELTFSSEDVVFTFLDGQIADWNRF